jgi:hypothetical protein
MSSWVSILQQLAELDPDDFDPADLSDEQLRETLPLTQVGINRLSAALTKSVAAGDVRQVQKADGVVSMKAWLTGHCRLSGRDAAALVRDGRRLPQLPALAAAYAAGDVTPAHVAVVTSAVTPARAAVAAANGIDLATTDAVLAKAAQALGPEDTAKAVRRWVAGIDPDGALDDAAGMPRVLRVAVSAEGRIHLSGHLDPIGGETLHAALEALMNADRPAGDTRTHGERMGDALVQLARQALRSGELPTVRGEMAQVRISIDLMALCADRAAPGFAGGDLPFAGPITPRPRAGWPATQGSYGSSPGRTDSPWTSAASSAPPPRRSAGRSSSATCTVSSPAVPPRLPGATSTMSSTGRTAARPPVTTAPCSASGTTPPSTRAAST